jgi:hypothetical protein
LESRQSLRRSPSYTHVVVGLARLHHVVEFGCRDIGAKQQSSSHVTSSTRQRHCRKQQRTTYLV